MNIVNSLTSLFHSKKDGTNAYVSLYLDSHVVGASFWSFDPNGEVHILASENEEFNEDSWKVRADAIDRLLGTLEERTKLMDVTKVILGLPNIYLTDSGEIQKEIRLEIKQLMELLDLQAMGFVPIPQALMLRMKKEEGVPPSVILLGIQSDSIAILIYKIGAQAGLREVKKQQDVAACVEDGLASFTDVEVLPARIVLHGSDPGELEEIKNQLLRHTWTPKINFLHFPKIEIASSQLIVDAVSLAGASELGNVVALGDKENTAQESVEQNQDETKTPVPEQSAEYAVDTKGEEETGEPGETQMAVADGTVNTDVDEEKVDEEVAVAQKDVAEDFAVDETTTADANVVMVDAESLGFKPDVDVLEEKQQMRHDSAIPAAIDEEEEVGTHQLLPKLPHVDFSGVFAGLGGLNLGSGGGRTKLLAVAGGVILLLVIALLFWTLPHATILIREIPKPVDASDTITIDPSATTVDAQNKIIPGKKEEQSVSGEKTIPVNGKKNIGDPAKGVVTIYNKSLDELTLKKGVILSTGGLQFTLDADSDIASASENIGSLTFGKTTANVTAVVIGTQGNLPAGNDFTIADTSTSVAQAHNDESFAGGTSKQITVVAKSDYDALVKAESADLVGQAQQQLSASIGGNEKLIDGTVTTNVTQKTFNQQIDQQATQLTGKLTITVSGIAYNEADIQAYLTSGLGDKVPSGYVIDEHKTGITVSDVVVKKNGTITAKVAMHAVALPTIDTAAVKNAVAGKSLTSAQAYVHTLTGVAALEVQFRLSPTKQWLPLNKNNITVSLAIQ